MFKKPVTVIKLKPTQYLLLVNLGNRVYSSLLNNASFVNVLPALTVLESQISDCQQALQVYGGTGHRGSHASYIDLKVKGLSLYTTLFSIAQFCQNVAQTAAGQDYPAMTAILSTSGFELKNAATPQGPLQAVQKFRQIITAKLAKNKGKLRWNLPLGIKSKNNVHSYSVRMSLTPDFLTATEIAEVTSGTFIDINTTAAPVQRYYWIVPFGTAGAGVPSDMVTMTLAAA